MAVPRILIVDDQLAQSPDLRTAFCQRVGLKAISWQTTDDDLETLGDSVVAGAIFCTGQRRVPNTNGSEGVVNDVSIVEAAVHRGWPNSAGWCWALILLDLRFDSQPPTDSDAHFGLDVLDMLVRCWPDAHAAPGNTAIPAVMLSSVERAQSAASANRAGARQYIEKSSLDTAKLRTVLEHHGLLEDEHLLGRSPSQRLLGRSLPMLRCLRDARNIAALGGHGNALILGAQGSGKSALASYIHSWTRRSGSFLQYFVTPTTEQMEYAALFGAWEGSYTGQRRDSYAGLAEKSHNGTLLIDEVHCLNSSSQSELLEFCRLDSQRQRWLTRLGKTIPTRPRDVSRRATDSLIGQLNPDTSKIAVDLLLLTASSEPLNDPQWRKKAQFSDPLFTRLCQEYAGGALFVPGLAEREADVSTLFIHFLEQQTRALEGAWPKEIDSSTAVALQAHGWTANVAELMGVANFAAQTTRDFNVVLPRHLPAHVVAANATPRRRSTTSRRRATATARKPAEAIAPATLVGALETVSNLQPRSIDDLRGALTQVNTAYGTLVAHLLEQALDITRDPVKAGTSDLGDLVPTRALKLLLQERHLTAAKAASAILRLAKRLPEAPAPESHTARAIAWATNRRR